MSSKQVLSDNDKQLLKDSGTIAKAQAILDAGFSFSLESIEEMRWDDGFVTVAWRMTLKSDVGKPLRVRARTVDEVVDEAYELICGTEIGELTP